MVLLGTVLLLALPPYAITGVTVFLRLAYVVVLDRFRLCALLFWKNHVFSFNRMKGQYYTHVGVLVASRGT